MFVDGKALGVERNQIWYRLGVLLLVVVVRNWKHQHIAGLENENGT